MRRLLLCLSILIVALASVPAAPALAQSSTSPEEFQALYLETLKSDRPDLAIVSVTTEQVVVEREDQTRFTTFLGNAYRRHMEGQPAAEAIAVLIGLIDRKPGALTADRAFALIRRSDFLDALDSLPVDAEMARQRPLHRPLVGDLMVIVAQDNVDVFNYPPAKDVVALYGGEDVAWTEIETHTLSEMGDITLSSAGSGISVLSAREDIAASLLLDDSLWASTDIRALGERPAVGVLKSGLLIVDSADPEARELLRRVMIQAADSSDFLSGNLFVRKDGQWRVLEP